MILTRIFGKMHMFALYNKDLSGENFSKLDLRSANFSHTRLDNSNFSEANLKFANFRDASLKRVNFKKANLQLADFTGADLEGAQLNEANVKYIKWDASKLYKTNLSRVKYPPKAIPIFKILERTDEGFIAYKSFGENFDPPKKWIIEPGSVIEEFGVNPDKTCDCASGINVAALGWTENVCYNEIWRVLIKWEDLHTVVVPYNTKGKFRVGRVTLIKIVRGKKLIFN